MNIDINIFIRTLIFLSFVASFVIWLSNSPSIDDKHLKILLKDSTSSHKIEEPKLEKFKSEIDNKDNKLNLNISDTKQTTKITHKKQELTILKKIKFPVM